MLYTDCTVTINGEKSVIDRPVVLYRGDKEVEIKFYIMKNTFYQSIVTRTTNVVSDVDASFSQLVIRIPEGEPIFSAVTPVEEDGAIIFKFTAEMIDEVQEVGAYDFQIRLLDENRTSRATIPPVTGGIKIKEPIAIENEPIITNDSNEVNVAQVNEAIITTATQLPAFDEQGNYIETTWTDKMLITDAKLNKIEDGITGVNEKIANLDLSGVDLTGYAKTEDIPTRVSQLTNDSNYVNTTQMNEAIANVTGQTIVEPQELDMPKVFFYGNALPTTKDNVNLTMDYISNTTKFSSFVKLKCQGTSSMSYAKKNFTITMFSDEARATKLKKDFKGWGAQSKFCLKANYVDTTHTRNISGARIAYDMVASRPDSTFKQQLLQCPRNGLVDGFPIKLYFNGEFYGIYTWNIPKDTWMFNMDKSNPNHIVLCAEKNTDGNSSAINSCQFRQLWTNGDGQDWSVEVGTMSEDLRTKFNRVIAFVMNATDQEFHDNIGDYFDLYSLLDYYCFSYLTCHLDGLAKNMLMVTYDGVIWGASLYDMDSIYGVSWNGGSFVSPQYQCPEQYQEQFSRLWQRIERCFGAELYARYLELRQGALSLSNIIKHVEEIYDVIPDRVFADEKAKWTNLPNVNNNTMTRFRNYMRDRAVYVDAQMQEIGTKVPCTGIVLSTDTLSFTTTDTQTLSVVVSPENCTDTVTWSVEPAGVVSINNGVVTPISNGTCTITATCGSYSDTCTVNVALPSVECTGISLDKTELALGPGQTDTSSEETIDVTQNTTAGYIICGASEVNGNGGMSSFGKTKSSALDTATDFIPFTSNDTLTISQPSSQFGCVVVVYDSNKQGLACYTANNTWEAGNTQSSTELKSLTMDIPAPPSETAYIRISFNLTDLSDVTVVKKYTNSGVSSYQLTATVTPTNCTQPVVWSVSPEGIVTVVDGLVTAVTNGEATVTATCGTQSANCAVTVSGMSESGGGNTDNYVTDSLYAYYDLTQLSTEATTVEDLSGNNNTFTVTRGTLSKDNLGGLIYSKDSNVLINSTSFNPQTAEASIEYTFKYTGMDNCNQQNNYANKNCGINGDNGQGYYNWIGGFGYCIFKSNTSIAQDIALPNTLVNGEYYHIVCTISDNEAKYYLNGELLGTYSHAITGIPNNTTYYLGATSSSAQACSNQVLYSSRFYNKVLSQDEVTQNYTYEFTKLGLISGGDTDIYTTAEYAITEPRTFNGTSDYIDTGLKLFDTAKTFTIFIDYTTSGTVGVGKATIFHCLYEVSPYRGLCLMEDGDGDSYFIGGHNNGGGYAINMPSTGKYMISFVNGVINNVVTLNNSNELVYSATNMASDNPYVQISENLLIGCYQDASGTKGRFWSGTINKFGVWYKQLTSNEINKLFEKNGGDSGENANLVFQVNSTSMNTVDNTLTDNIAGISATLTGNPTVSGNQIAFDVDDTFSFDISSLNLTNSDRTFRIKFTPTTLDNNTRNVIGVGTDGSAWMSMTSAYMTNEYLRLQHGNNGFGSNTVGGATGGNNNNRLPASPVTGQEYELVISEQKDGNVRWFVDGILVQDGTTTCHNPLCLSNTEGNARFVGNYSLIEIYNGYCDNYAEFTNMVNNVNHVVK